VRGALLGFFLFKDKGLSVKVFLEDGFHTFKRVRLNEQRSQARRFEAI
jgi:hypothetical protein